MIPVITRVKEMFAAQNPYQQSILQDFLFDRIIQIVEQPEDIDWDISHQASDAKEFIDECYSYLTIARIKSEYKVMFTNSKTASANLRRSDEFYMKGIIDHRDFIFTNYN